MSEAPAKETKILIADDEPMIRKLLSHNVVEMGFTPIEAKDGQDCIEKLEQEDVNAILLDLEMPRKDGMQVLNYVKRKYPIIPVIMVTAVDDVQTAVSAIKAGAYDYITKPVDVDRLKTVLKNALAVWQLRQEVGSLQSRLRKTELFSDIVGESKRLKQVFNLVEQVLVTDVNVLIIGESGTGKELLARAIHDGSRRREGPFVPVNSAAINPELADSLLFGHKKGAFTGAHEDTAGYFEQANGGTIFLDEIGDMPMDIQAKVLRILEEKMVRRVGEQKERKLDFRVIAATNRDLTRAVQEGTFRQDLYFRLEEYPIYLPPLRERKEDIPLLAQHFLDDFCQANNLPPKRLSEQAMIKLMAYSWPGNVRELRNVVRRAAIRAQGDVVDDVMLSDIEEKLAVPKVGAASATEREPGQAVTPEAGESEIVPMDKIEEQAIKRAYLLSDRNAIEAAKLLGISRATMYRKLKKFGIED